MTRKNIFVSLIVFAFMMLAGAGSAFGADGVTAEMHRYSPAAHDTEVQQEETGNDHKAASVRECTGQVHAPNKHCRLTAWLAEDAGEEAKKTTFIIRDLKINTIEKDNHTKKKDLHQYLMKKLRLVCRDSASGEIKKNFSVASISGTDLLKYIEIPAGNISVTVDVGLAPEGSKKAEVYVQTNIHLIYRDKKKDKEESAYEDEYEEDYYGDDSGDIDDDGEDAAEKRKAAERKAKAKALKAKIKKYTAFVDPKERSEDKDVAVASAEDEQPQEGPNAVSIILLMAAAAAAAIFGYLIRSDMKVMRWYKQKKALRRK